jgi:hypothetical protein
MTEDLKHDLDVAMEFVMHAIPFVKTCQDASVVQRFDSDDYNLERPFLFLNRTGKKY